VELLMRHWSFPVILQVLVFAPIWQWYCRRLTDGSEEPWGLVALGTALVLLFAKKASRGNQPRLEIPAIMILLYAASYPMALRLVCACIAVTTLGMTLSAIRLGTWFHVPTLGLMLLSLPVIPSLQFYSGYPLRVLSAAIAAPLLQLSGLAVVREGACLRWGHELVSIDAPCSGLQMLWVGLYGVLTMAGLLELRTRGSLMLVFLAFPTIVLGNAARSASLFYLETGLIQLPAWWHDAVGVSAFTLAASCLVVVALAIRSRGGRSCEV
jgi:exosortase/archaeosortase family protein